MMHYLGGGFILGVPARDLTASEVEQFGRERLLESGFYRETASKPAPSKDKRAPAASSNKAGKESEA